MKLLKLISSKEIEIVVVTESIKLKKIPICKAITDCSYTDAIPVAECLEKLLENVCVIAVDNL